MFTEIAEAPALDKKLKHDIDIVVDRVVVRPDIAARLADSLETALKIADGIAIAELADRPSSFETRPAAAPQDEGLGGKRKRQPSPHPEVRAERASKDEESPERLVFSEKFACPVSGFTIAEIEPRLFSFNNPVRRLPRMRRARHQAGDRRRPRHPRPGAHPEGRRHRALVQDLLALFPADAGRPGAPLQVQGHGERGRTCPTRRGTPSCTAPAMRRSPSSMTTACANTRRKKPSRASSPTWSGAGRRPTRNGCARRSAAISPACRARLRRRAAEAGGAGGEARRPPHQPGGGDVDPRRRATGSPTLPPTLTKQQNEIAARILKEIRERLRFPERRRPRLSHARRATPARCRAARASASASPARSAPASPACSTCSTSRRSACTSATTRGCWKR